MKLPVYPRLLCPVLFGCSVLSVWNAVSAEDLVAARHCSAIGSETLRLACYDAAFRAAPAPAPATPATVVPGVVIPPPPPARSFGDTGDLPVERKAKESLPRTLNATVKKAVELHQGLYRLTLDNDQVWETHEAYWAVQFKADDAIQITRMPLGGYQISLAGQGRSLSVRRIK